MASACDPMTNFDNPRMVIVGGGAMGGLFGALLAEGGLDVTLVDVWKEHVETINRNGLRIVGHGGDRSIRVRATTDPRSLGAADIILFQCKAFANEAAAQSVRHVVKASTAVISFQNGLGNEEALGRIVGAEHVLGRLKKIEDEAVGPRSAEALQALEGAIGKVAGQRLRQRQPLARGCSASCRRGCERLDAADQATGGAIRELRHSCEALDERLSLAERGAEGGVAQRRRRALRPRRGDPRGAGHPAGRRRRRPLRPRRAGAGADGRARARRRAALRQRPGAHGPRGAGSRPGAQPPRPRRRASRRRRAPSTCAPRSRASPARWRTAWPAPIRCRPRRWRSSAPRSPASPSASPTASATPSAARRRPSTTSASRSPASPSASTSAASASPASWPTASARARSAPPGCWKRRARRSTSAWPRPSASSPRPPPPRRRAADRRARRGPVPASAVPRLRDARRRSRPFARRGAVAVRRRGAGRPDLRRRGLRRRGDASAVGQVGRGVDADRAPGGGSEDDDFDAVELEPNVGFDVDDDFVQAPKPMPRPAAAATAARLVADDPPARQPVPEPRRSSRNLRLAALAAAAPLTTREVIERARAAARAASDRDGAARIRPAKPADEGVLQGLAFGRSRKRRRDPPAR